MMSTSGYQFPVQNPAAYSTSSSSNSVGSYSSYNGDWRRYLTDLANSGDQGAIDRLLSYLMSENSAQIARDWTANREDTAWQRMVADMKAAGINPYAFATFGGSPISSSSGGNSYSGSNLGNYAISSQKLDKEQQKIEQNWLKIALSSALPIIGAVIAAML